MPAVTASSSERGVRGTSHKMAAEHQHGSRSQGSKTIRICRSARERETHSFAAIASEQPYCSELGTYKEAKSTIKKRSGPKRTV